MKRRKTRQSSRLKPYRRCRRRYRKRRNKPTVGLLIRRSSRSSPISASESRSSARQSSSSWRIVLPMLPKAQAQIELSYPPENAYMMKEDDGFVGWMIHFYSTNVSDVPFTPTYAQAKWYEGDKLNGSSPAIDYEYMRNWMESDALVKGEMPLDLYCGTDKLNVDRGVFIISGTDANGHELKFSISIDLIHEFPPESEN